MKKKIGENVNSGESEMPGRKSYHLKKMAQYTNLHPSEIILFDDDERNVLQAREEGYFAVYVGGYQGFKFTELTCGKASTPRKPLASIKNLVFQERPEVNVDRSLMLNLRK